MKKRLILFLIVVLIPFVFANPENIPVSIFLENTVNITNATGAWSFQVAGQNITGAGQTFCVPDTGMNFSHPDLLGKNKTCNINCLTQNCVENCSTVDDNGHGTHVAGILAANGTLKGVAPDAKLIGVKVLNASGDGNLADIISGINWCTDNAQTYGINIISLSLGTSFPNTYSNYCDNEVPSLTNAINTAIGKNISVIAATGNEGSSTKISLPSCVENVTAVSWTDDNDSINPSANYNSITDLFAPGTEVNSTGFTGGYVLKSGTSMSTPHVAAAFALINQFYLLQRNLTASPLTVENNLKRSGKEIILGIKRINILQTILDILKPVVTLSFPQNNSYLENQTNFTCLATSPDNYNITNITFYLWNNTKLLYTQTNFSNYSATFNYTLYRGIYEWNCEARDENNYLSFYPSNFTLNFLSVTPIVTLISPENNTNVTSTNSVEFVFNSTEVDLANCSLILNGNVSSTISSNLEGNMSITQTLSNGNYNWSVNCTHQSYKTNSSETRSINIDYTPIVISSSSGGGGGGGSSQPREYTLTQTEITTGSSRLLSKNGKIKLTVQNEAHTLTLKNIEKTSVELLVESEPQTIFLNINETKKVSLIDGFFNLKITLNRITHNKADISIKEINEKIPALKEKKVTALTGKVIKETKNETKPEEIPIPQKRFNNSSLNVVFGLLLTMILIVIVSILIAFYKIITDIKPKKNSKKKKGSKKTK